MYTRLQTVWSLPGPSRQSNKGHSPRCHRRPNDPGRLADTVVQPTTQSAEGCTYQLEVSFLNPHTHKPWVDPTHVGRCGLHKLVSDSRGYFVGSRNSKVKQKCTENAILLYIMQAI